MSSKEEMINNLMDLGDKKYTPTDSERPETESHAILLFKKPAGSASLYIQGTEVIPKFPITLLMMAVTFGSLVIFTEVGKHYHVRSGLSKP